jgi:uncharacterized membrane protein YukC
MIEDFEAAVIRVSIYLEKVKMENAQLKELLNDVRHFVPAEFEELRTRIENVLKTKL